MSIKKSITNWLKRFFSLDQFNFENVIIDKEVIDTIIELAKQTYPKEFIAFLEGGVSNNNLRVSGLAYQEYTADRHSTHFKTDFPLTSRIVGTVHSHPGPSNQPSNADLRSFSKKGILHLIIKTPYRAEDIQAYDAGGRRISFAVAN